MQPDLTISIISAENQELLLACLDSVYASTHNFSLEVWVVDNASTDSTAEAVAAAFPEVKIIRNEIRQGFSTNNNLVLDRGIGRYFILLNDDTLVQDGSLDRMIEFMDTHPHAGAISCDQIDPDGSSQHAFGRFPNPFIEALWPSANWSYMLVHDREEPFEVDWVCGAAMLVRREIITQIGVLDKTFDPIYSEEIDWCYRIKQARWEIWVLPEAQIIHYGGRTMNRALPRKYKLLLSHKALFFRKHKGRAAAAIYKAMLALSTSGKLLWWTCKSLLDGDRDHCKERMRLHYYVLTRIPSL